MLGPAFAFSAAILASRSACESVNNRRGMDWGIELVKLYLYLIGVAHGCGRSTVVRTPVRLFRRRAPLTELQEYQNIAIDDVLTLKTDETVNGDALMKWLNF